MWGWGGGVSRHFGEKKIIHENLKKILNEANSSCITFHNQNVLYIPKCPNTTKKTYYYCLVKVKFGTYNPEQDI